MTGGVGAYAAGRVMASVLGRRQAVGTAQVISPVVSTAGHPMMHQFLLLVPCDRVVQQRQGFPPVVPPGDTAMSHHRKVCIIRFRVTPCQRALGADPAARVLPVLRVVVGVSGRAVGRGQVVWGVVPLVGTAAQRPLRRVGVGQVPQRALGGVGVTELVGAWGGVGRGVVGGVVRRRVVVLPTPRGLRVQG